MNIQGPLTPEPDPCDALLGTLTSRGWYVTLKSRIGIREDVLVVVEHYAADGQHDGTRSAVLSTRYDALTDLVRQTEPKPVAAADAAVALAEQLVKRLAIRWSPSHADPTKAGHPVTISQLAELIGELSR